MSTFAIILLSVQACLVQNVYSQCLRGPFGPGIAGPLGWETGFAGPTLGWEAGLAGPFLGCDSGLAPAMAAYPGYAAYGGAGVGNVAVDGEMAVAGTTLVAGQVPILGAVEFGGIVPAAGTVTIIGNCGCGCNGPAFTAAVLPFAAPFASALASPLAAPIASPLAAPCVLEAADIPASNGGGLEVASGSAMPPSGVSILSENAIEGALAVTGALPFLGTVALEGALPTAGAGAVDYACGNGAVAILAEDIAPMELAGPLGYGVGPLADAFGYGPLGYGSLGYGPLGYGSLGYGPFGYGPLGYGIGPMAGPYRGGCGYGRFI